MLATGLLLAAATYKQQAVQASVCFDAMQLAQPLWLKRASLQVCLLLPPWLQVLAVREGHVRLHGQPKLPPWTLLNATADPGDTFVTINGPVNWAVGDRIVIASSSFYATDVDEVTITNVTCVQPSCEVVRLDLELPLTYTHLGEAVTIPGDERQHLLDMRAEVAVLNRLVSACTRLRVQLS